MHAASERDLLRLSVAYADGEPQEALPLLESLPVEESTTRESGERWYCHALVLLKLGRIDEAQDLLIQHWDELDCDDETYRSVSQLLGHVVLSRAKAAGEGDGTDWGFLSEQVDRLRKKGIENDWLRYLKASAHMELGAWGAALGEFEAIRGPLDEGAEPPRWTDYARALVELGHRKAAWDLLNARIDASWPEEMQEEGRRLLDDIEEEIAIRGDGRPCEVPPRDDRGRSRDGGRSVVPWDRIRVGLSRASRADSTWFVVYSIAAPAFTAWLAEESLPLLGRAENAFEPSWFLVAAGFTVVSWLYWARLFGALFLRR